MNKMAIRIPVDPVDWGDEQRRKIKEAEAAK